MTCDLVEPFLDDLVAESYVVDVDLDDMLR